ncbi:hypothetical protein [Halalkalibaculum sp. DA384]|uniref:hypothetical protein n=1 Tax=Halalkalibaculum sp. DA384 TaxID=3373606 RepID=UPI00375494B2
MGTLLGQVSTQHAGLGAVSIPDSYLKDDPAYYPELPEEPTMTGKEWNQLSEKEKQAWMRYQRDQKVKINQIKDVRKGIERIEQMQGRPATRQEVDLLLKTMDHNRLYIDDGNDRVTLNSGASAGDWLAKNPGIAALIQPAKYKDDNYLVVKRFSEAERNRLKKKKSSFTLDDMLKYVRLYKRIHINDKGQTRYFESEQNLKEWLQDHPEKLKELERNKTGSSAFVIKKPPPRRPAKTSAADNANRPDNRSASPTGPSQANTTATDSSSTASPDSKSATVSSTLKRIPTWGWGLGGVALLLLLNR